MKAKPYWNPYLAGVLLGLTLLATFMIASQGLGASAFPKRTLALVGSEVAPEWTHPILGCTVTELVHEARGRDPEAIISTMLFGN